MIGKLFRALLGGLFVAGLVHVIAVLLIPQVAEDDADSRLRDALSPWVTTVIPADGSVLPDLDPAFVHAACSVNVHGGVSELRGEIPTDRWTLAVVSKTAGVVASLDNSGISGSRIEVVAGLGPDVERVRLSQANGTPASAYAVLPSDLGFFLVRAYVPDAADRPGVAAALAELECVNQAADDCTAPISAAPAGQTDPALPSGATATGCSPR